MKKLIPAIVLAIILSFGVAYGQDTSYSLGLKAWVNSWEFEIDLAGISETSDPAFMIGPSFSVKKDKFFGGASVLFTAGEYEWDMGGDEYERATRADFDILAGYMFHPRIGGFIGYKYLAADMEYEDAFGATYDDGTVYLSGPGFGVTGNLPVSKVIVLYGSLSWMILDFEWEFSGGGSYTSDADGFSFEFGAVYIISSNWNANIGIKYQSFEEDIIMNRFAGLTFGANYRF